MFPVPIVADKAVHNAAKLDTSPFASSSPSSSSLTNKYLSASGNLNTCINFNLKVKYIPVPTNNISKGGPHTILSILFNTFSTPFKNSIKKSSLKL